MKITMKYPLWKKLAVSGGIEADEVYMDHTGLNTYDTIVHSLEFFNKGSTIVIVTQSYHLYRALYLAQRMGLNAYGVSADSDIVYRGQLYREFREMAARLKDLLVWYYSARTSRMGKRNHYLQIEKV